MRGCVLGVRLVVKVALEGAHVFAAHSSVGGEVDLTRAFAVLVEFSKGVVLGAQMHVHIDGAKASLPVGFKDRLEFDGHATLVSLGDIGACLGTNGWVGHGVDVAIHVGNLRVHSSAGVLALGISLYSVGNEIVA